MGQKKLLILYFFVSIMLGFTMDSSFIVSYFPMIAMMLVISTIAYDNHENGVGFLMTMPVSQGDYAVAKYIFSVIGLFSAWVVAIFVQFISLFIQKTPFVVSDIVLEDFMILPVFFIITSIMIPVEFKFSSEKSKIVLFVICGIIILIMLAGKSVLEFVQTNFGVDFEAMAAKADTLSPITVIAVLYAFCVVIISISMVISIRIMKKKEF